MRTIKFRAWDKETNQMCYMDNPHWSLMAHKDGMGVYNLQNGSGGDEYELMQFTGLKDKNGKEIYEGDIVEWKQYKDGPYPMALTDENKELKRKVVEYSLKTPFIGFTLNEGYEVIGNIYENKELLK